MDNDFRPWEGNYWTSCSYSAFGLIVGWLLFSGNHVAPALLASAAGSFFGWREFRIGRPREYGIEVEGKAIADLRQHLEPLGFDITSGLMLSSGGNIDALVRPPSSPFTFVVEIKSYGGIIHRRWGALTKVGRLTPLINEPSQVWLQCDELGRDRHVPVLWCPTSNLCRTGYHKDILLINGGVQLLKEMLDWYPANFRLSAVVRFGYKPPKRYRDGLRNRGFQWKPQSRSWRGRTTLLDGKTIREFVSEVGGKFLFKRHWYE